MITIKVECYAGYKGEQSPRRFRLGDRQLAVDSVEDQWYGPSSEYFRVLASDGHRYVLRHDAEGDAWTLEAFRQRDCQGGRGKV